MRCARVPCFAQLLLRCNPYRRTDKVARAIDTIAQDTLALHGYRSQRPIVVVQRCTRQVLCGNFALLQRPHSKLDLFFWLPADSHQLLVIAMGNAGSSARTEQPASAAATSASASTTAPASASTLPDACPVKQDGYRNPAVYNVYGERINDPNAAAQKNPLMALKNSEVLDPRNNMPLEPSQLPCPGQRKVLPTERVASNIPKGGTDSTWLFPSPQMVFNALRRKGKGDDVTEDDMEGFVHAHNGEQQVQRRRELEYGMCF